MKTLDTDKVSRKQFLAVQEGTKPALPKLAFSMQESADALGVSYISVHRLLKRGLLKSSTALRRKLIPASELARFLNDTLA